MVEKAEKKIKVRSPNYPGYSLGRCLEWAGILYEKYKKTSVAFEVAAKAINFSAKSSSGLQAMASLSYYGLITIEGIGKNRRINVSELAFKILIDKRPDSKDRGIAIKEAALNPPFFKRIKEHYGAEFPDDSLLEYDLPAQFKFNPGTVKDFIRVYKETMSFAKAYENDIISDDQTPPEESKMKGNVTPDGAKANQDSAPPRPFAQSEIAESHEIGNYSVGQNTWVRLLASGSLTQKSIDRLIAFLTMIKEDFPLESEKKDN